MLQLRGTGLGGIDRKRRHSSERKGMEKALAQARPGAGRWQESWVLKLGFRPW